MKIELELQSLYVEYALYGGDFIVQRPLAPLALEAKLTFPRAMPSAFKSFLQADASDPAAYRVVGLYRMPTGERVIYPWQVGNSSGVQQ